MIDTKELRMDANDSYVAHTPLELCGSELIELLDRLEAAEAYCIEQARVSSMRESREAALMAKLESAEKERDELRTELKEVRREVAMTHYTINTLQAKIEALEQQEPVASVWRCDNGHIHGSCERTLPMGTKLYALPGAKGE